MSGGSVANADALKEVVNYVSLMASKSHRVVLYDLVEDRFGRRPYGWNDWESVEITGNIDNLVTLFIDRIDADRLALRQEIEASLQRLERETLVNRNGEDYFFLTNEERDVSREIKNVDLGSGEETKLLGELIFDEMLGTLRKYRYPENNKDFGITKFCDLHPYGNRSEGDLVVSVLTPLSDEYEDFGEARCITHSTMDDGQVLIRLDDDKALARELRTYLQTDKYIKRKHDGTAPQTTLKILRERQEENRERKERLKAIIERLMKEAKFYAAGQQRPAPSGSVGAAVDEALGYLVKNSFPKLGFLKNPATNPQASARFDLAERIREGRRRVQQLRARGQRDAAAQSELPRLPA